MSDWFRAIAATAVVSAACSPHGSGGRLAPTTSPSPPYGTSDTGSTGETGQLEGWISLELDEDEDGFYGGPFGTIRTSFQRAPAEQGEWPPADWSCQVHTWGYPDFSMAPGISPGALELFLQGEPLDPDAYTIPWVPGATFGAHASGGEFPPFDARDAIRVPFPLDVALPEVIDDEADLELSWSPPFADLVLVWLSQIDSTHAGQDLMCYFADDGSATVPAAMLQELTSPTWMEVLRYAVWTQRMETAELLIQSHARRSAWINYD